MSKQTKVSIDSQLQIQAENIFIRRPLSFGNWQDVIRLAIHYGLPEIGRVQERERLHQAGIDMRQATRRRLTEARGMRNVPAHGSICCLDDEKTCRKPSCQDCPDWIEYKKNK